MKNTIITLILLLCTLFSFAQEKHTISGTVNDKHTGETVIGAVVRIEGTTIGTTTNEYGFYSLSLPSGDYVVKVNYMGYLEPTLNVSLDKVRNIGIIIERKNSGNVVFLRKQ